MNHDRVYSLWWRSPLPFAAGVLAVLLAGCDNARESVQFGAWQAAATAAPASNPDGDLEITATTEEPGTGAEIARGDLVHLRYARTVTWSNGTPHADRSGDVWLWTGGEPDAPMDFWGDFGSPELRAALVGKRVGERFELRVIAPYGEIHAPAYGIAAPHSPRRGLNEFIGATRASVPSVLAGGEHAWNQASWSTITIAAACRATLETRAGQLIQWGYHFNMFGSAYQTDRAGILRWSRLEAKCAAPDGEVKFVLGPIYWRSEPWASGVLMAWQSSYMSKVARASHPEDYDYASIDGKALALWGN